MLDSLVEQLRRLDLRDGNIKPTVGNLKIIASIRNKLQGIIINDKYVEDVKDFIKVFKDITNLQNQYWRSLENNFEPPAILKEIRQQTIEKTVNDLTEAGIGEYISSSLEEILRTNITGGGSYRDLEDQLKASILGTESVEAKISQIVVDSANQYAAQYSQTVSMDLGYEWYWYQGSLITTSRDFCIAMVALKYFHLTEIPRLLRAEDLFFKDKNGKLIPVELNPKTDLPKGMIPMTNATNFLVRRGGYKCGHQIRPIPEKLVPESVKQRVFATQAYKTWKS